MTQHTTNLEPRHGILPDDFSNELIAAFVVFGQEDRDPRRLKVKLGNRAYDCLKATCGPPQFKPAAAPRTGMAYCDVPIERAEIMPPSHYAVIDADTGEVLELGSVAE